MRTLLLVLLCTAVTSWAEGQMHTQLHLMPLPQSMHTGNGQLVVGPSFSVAITGYSDVRLRAATERFLANLRRQTGMSPLNMSLTKSTSATLTVRAERGNKEVPELGEDESYALEITTSGATLNAATSLGVMRGFQTFLQLVENTPAGFAVPVVSIQDKPRFSWRGLMIDSSRHFIPLNVIKRNLDGMEAVKLNVFHWHLSDNQGFRVESKKFPRLHEMGSDGLFYTQAEVRELVEYANARGVQVVPEFDMPGHSTAWFVGHPELSSGPGPYEIERRWGVFDPAMDPTREQTYKFLNELIGEMAALFPGEYFHIGGDEVNGKQWDANPKVQEFMRVHDLKNNEALQAYFTTRVQKIVRQHKKTMMGWDEVLDAEIPKDIVVHVWRQQARLASAVQKGYRGVFSYGYYLDLMWPAAQHYAVDPLAADAANLTAEEQKRVLGAEACMWTEYASAENIDARIWPRMAAVAERFWSPQTVQDPASMYERLGPVSQWLEWRGLTHSSVYLPMLRRISGADDIEALKVLAEVVEPAKDYRRHGLAVAEPTSATPLNRLVDAARPESTTSRQFATLVDALVSGNIKPGTEMQIRAQLTKWRDQQAAILPGAEQSSLLQEVVPLSQSLSALGSAGLQALEYIDRGERPPASWKVQQMGIVQEAKDPKAQLLLVIVPSVKKLIEAATEQ